LNREREIVRWVSRLGAVSVEQIGRRFGVGRSVAYEQVRRLVKFGLLERTQTAIGDPTLISATCEVITYAGLGLKRPTIRLGEVDHFLPGVLLLVPVDEEHPWTIHPLRIRIWFADDPDLPRIEKNQ